ncbi:MAG: hypothetical protein U0670_08150 [Anaerolineae bacterium]
MSLSNTMAATSDDVLTHMQAGMHVLDVNRREFGVVASVYLSGVRSVDTDASPVAMIPTIAGTFVEDKRLPELLLVRLGRTGFVKVTPMLERIWACYYITPQQVLTIRGKQVFLKVPYDVLIRN